MKSNVLIVRKSWEQFENSIEGSENSQTVNLKTDNANSKKKMKSGNRKGMKSEKKSSKRLSQNNSILQIDRSIRYVIDDKQPMIVRLGDIVFLRIKLICGQIFLYYNIAVKLSYRRPIYR
jgi:hypothetical protein